MNERLDDHSGQPGVVHIDLEGDDDGLWEQELWEQQRQGDSGPDTRGNRGDESNPGSAAQLDWRDGEDRGVGDAEHAARDDQHEDREQVAFEPERFWIELIPPAYLDKVLAMGGGVGLSAVIDEVGDQTLEHVLERLQSGKQQLWTVAENNEFVGRCVTHVEERDTGKVLVIAYAAGTRIEEWAGPICDALRGFGRSQGCNRMFAIGRRGWTKFVNSYGWNQGPVLYWSEL